MMTSLGTMNPQKNMTDEEEFKNWYSTHGIRYFSPFHGSANGHEDYMRVAFEAGKKTHDLPKADEHQ